jgi:hypothetical protein
MFHSAHLQHHLSTCRVRGSYHSLRSLGRSSPVGLAGLSIPSHTSWSPPACAQWAAQSWLHSSKWATIRRLKYGLPLLQQSRLSRWRPSSRELWLLESSQSAPGRRLCFTAVEGPCSHHREARVALEKAGSLPRLSTTSARNKGNLKPFEPLVALLRHKLYCFGY